MADAKERKGAPRWHFVYIALAGFNLLTILLSITITQNLMGLYTDTVERDGEWTSRVAAIEHLANLGQDVVGSVSQTLVFGARGRQAPRTAMRATTSSASASPDLNKDIAANVDPADAALLATTMAQANEAMTVLVAASNQVFTALDAGKLGVVAQGIVTITDRASQADADRRRRRRPWIARHPDQAPQGTGHPRPQPADGGVRARRPVLLMVLGAAIYGHKLGKVMRTQHQDIERNRARRRSGQPGQVELPRLDEPRDPHADERHSRHGAVAEIAELPTAERDKVVDHPRFRLARCWPCSTTCSTSPRSRPASSTSCPAPQRHRADRRPRRPPVRDPRPRARPHPVFDPRRRPAAQSGLRCRARPPVHQQPCLQRAEIHAHRPHRRPRVLAPASPRPTP